MKRYMKNRNQFLQISKQIIYPSRILLFFLVTSLTLFSCDKFLQENLKDKLPEEDVYNTISEVYLNAVASLYTYIGGYSDSQGLQGTGRGVYDLNTFTSDEAIIPTRGGDWYDGGFWQGLYLHDWGVENDAIQAIWEYLYTPIVQVKQQIARTDRQVCRNPFRCCTSGIPGGSAGHASHVLLLSDGFVRTHPVGSILFSGNERGCPE